MEYLQVSKGYMSLVISGKKKLSEENFRKLIENPYGWDVSMLEEQAAPELIAENIPQLSNVEILLRDMLAEKEAKITAVKAIYDELEVGREAMLEIKRLHSKAMESVESLNLGKFKSEMLHRYADMLLGRRK